MEKIEILIHILLDSSAREDERDDAAIDLGTYIDDRALNALVKVASNRNEDEMILDSCGESIAEIFFKKHKFSKTIYRKLSPVSKEAILSYLKESKKEWIKKYNLE